MPASALRSLLRDPRRPDWFLIGETAHNHEGDLDYAHRAVAGLAAMPEVGAIKIHMNLVLSSYASIQFTEGDVYGKFIWTAEEHGQLIDRIKAAGKDAVVLANDLESLDYLMGRGDVDAIELHAVSLYDVPMLEKLRAFDGVVVLGIGGTPLEEVQAALDRLEADGPKDVLLVHGFQNFPSRPEDVNMARMVRTAALLGREVAYADHTAHDDPDNAFVSTLGYAMGARILEKHFSPTAGVKRIDYQSSVGADVFARIIHQMKLIQAARGTGSLAWSQAETDYGCYGVMKKAMVAARDLPAGHVLTAQDIAFKRTSNTLPMRQGDYDRLLGRVLTTAVPRDHMLSFTQTAVAGDAAP